MSRARVGAAAVVLLLPLLAGCGHGPSYCGRVKAHQSGLGAIVHSGEKTALIEALPAFEDLAAAAPSDVASDWKLLVSRISGLRSALDGAGVDPASYDPAHPPAGLSAADRTRIRDAAAQLAAADTQQALADVQQEVLDVCHTPLDL